MAIKGGQKGNKNAQTGRMFADAVRWALQHYENDRIKAGQALKEIGLKLVAQAIDGQRDAIAEIANRLDGKPGQFVEATIHHESPPTFEEVKIQFTKEYGEKAAQFLLGEITESEYLESVKPHSTEVLGNTTLN